MLVFKVAILWMAIGLLDKVYCTYVHLNEKCFLKAAHRYCQQHYPGYLKGCQARLDRKNLVMKAEDSQICYIGSSNGKCISYDICIAPEIFEECRVCRISCPKLRCNRDLDRIPRYWIQKDENKVVAYIGVNGLPSPLAISPTAIRSTTPASTRRATTRSTTTAATTTTTTTTTAAIRKIRPDLSSYAETWMNDDKFGGDDWPPSHGQPTSDWTDETSHREPNVFSVLGLATPIEVVLFCTLIALGVMLLLHLALLGCQLCFVWSQKRTNQSLDQVLTKVLKTWQDYELDQERGLAVRTNSDGPAVIGVLQETNSFKPDGTSGFHRSTGAIPKTKAKSARGTGGNVNPGGLFGSLTRVKPPQAPPMPPRRSMRSSSSGPTRTLNSLPALNQFDTIELDDFDESHV